MTFLPIVERELRIAARRRFTFWGRLLAALLGLIIWTGLQLLGEVSSGSGFRAGQVQFSILKWLSFLFAASAGIFLTADSLSEEKREGTLGLLFLTDLRGYDVVLGKFMSHSLQAFYALLAAFPLLALTLLAGGVTGGEFGRSLLVICNTLFLSLSLGMLVSSVSRDVIKSMNGCLLVMLVLLLGLPWADSGLEYWNGGPFVPVFSTASPGYLFEESSYPLRNFWWWLGLQHLIGWSFLAFASLAAARTWQEKTHTVNAGKRSISRQWRFGSKRFRLALRRRLLDKDPVRWLMVRDRFLPRLVWGITAIGVGLVCWGIYDSGEFRGPLLAASFLQIFFVAGLELWMTTQACRFFIDAARNGALELVLVTPTGPERIIHNQWRALAATFLVPALLVVFVQTAGGIVAIFQMQNILSATKGSGNFDFEIYQIINSIVGAVKFLGNLAAVGWFGMWMGLTNRKTLVAVMKTICFVLILPALGLLFLTAIMMVGRAATSFGGNTWIPQSIAPMAVGVVSVTKNLLFILYARRNMLQRFRETVALAGNQTTFRSLPPQTVVRVPPAFAATRASTSPRDDRGGQAQ